MISELRFDVLPFLDRPARAFGWLATPARAGPFPAMLLIHGGGGRAMERWARAWCARGYVALAIDLYGQGPGGARLPDGGCDWSDMAVAFDFAKGVENTWIYQAVGSCVRAISALRSLPDVDPERVGVTGVSWGGYLCSTVMSIDPRVALGMPAMGCGFDSRAGHAADATPEACRRVHELFDPSNYLPMCRNPVLWIGGVADPPPEQLINCVGAVPGPQTLAIRVQPHHNDPRFMGAIFDRCEAPIFADSVFRGCDPLPSIGVPEQGGRRVSASCVAAAGCFNWAMHRTTELHRPAVEREWTSTWCGLDDGRLWADLPDDRPSMVLFTVTDERGALASSAFHRVSQ